MVQHTSQMTQQSADEEHVPAAVMGTHRQSEEDAEATGEGNEADEGEGDTYELVPWKELLPPALGQYTKDSATNDAAAWAEMWRLLREAMPRGPDDKEPDEHPVRVMPAPIDDVAVDELPYLDKTTASSILNARRQL